MAPDTKALCLIERILDPQFAIRAEAPDGTLLGLAGYKTNGGGFAKGSLEDMCAVYGAFGGTWRGLLLDFLERDLKVGELLMDGIFVSEQARGQGIGSKLLDAICAEADSRHSKSVRLDVIDTNPRARALYHRKGFEDAGVETIGILKHIFGFSSATKMIKRL
ncbi:GNAT family N-acetyltransferase [Roseibium hamelinense]|uniref:GNAT family N-acetyltransferase n=1 Tax=Roseibium hamelinense TaxID=150831 RepID=UPI001FCC9512|nr:GNAT family N-acetyltransferase [Roseibium hamelinense]